jgi:hypothetical protein
MGAEEEEDEYEEEDEDEDHLGKDDDEDEDDEDCLDEGESKDEEEEEEAEEVRLPLCAAPWRLPALARLALTPPPTAPLHAHAARSSVTLSLFFCSA